MAGWDRGCSSRELCLTGALLPLLPRARPTSPLQMFADAADVCRCLQMCCWPQQQDRSPASPGHSVSLGSSRKQSWSSASCWIHLQPGSSTVAKAGWGMWGCTRVSPQGTCVLGRTLPVSHQLLVQDLESVLCRSPPVLLDPALGEPGGPPSAGWAGRPPAGMRAHWWDQVPLPSPSYSSFCLFLK